MCLIVPFVYLSCKETISVPNLGFILICCMWYPHTAPFMKNKIPYSPLETPKTHVV